jgi:hypothetical protein
VGREIKAQRGRTKQAHFRCDVFKDLAVLAAADAMDTDDAPPDGTVFRLVQNAGNPEAVFFEGESSFHIVLPESVSL